MLLLKAGHAAGIVGTVVVHVHAKDFDKFLMRMIDGLVIVEAHVLGIEQYDGGQYGHLGAAQVELLQLAYKVEVLLYEVALLLVEIINIIIIVLLFSCYI